MGVDVALTTGAGEGGQAGSAWPRFARLRAWAARHGTTVDVVFTVVVIGAAWAPRAVLAPTMWWGILAQSVLAAPLVLRRRYPRAVFGWLYLVAIAQWWTGRAVLIDAALLIALYSVAAHCVRRQALIAAGALEAGVVIAALRWANGGIDGILAAVVFLSGLVTAAFVLGVNIRTRRAYLASLEDRAIRAERERDQQSQLAAAAERTRIAREMHDIVAHNLSVLIALADGFAFAAESDPVAAAAAAAQASEVGRQALGEMQRLVGVLRGTEADGDEPRAPQPGLDQIDDLLTQVRAAGLPTTLTVSGTRFLVPPSAQLAVYRVVQESLTNVLKHAKEPTRAQVTLTYAEPTIVLYVCDDGRGEPLPANGTGHGITGMRERASVFGGHVDAGPRRHGGWQVRAILTCPRPA
ncbi:MAG TPA: histidine kinase [Pseudonocardiaceae bacterium]|nr:histidine kinase [Pseudonocardiaceae bacterium]